MSMALNYDLFMDADMMTEEVVTNISPATASNNIEISKEYPEIKIVELDFGNIHIAKMKNQNSEIKKSKIEKDLIKGYMKLLSNFEN